MSAIEDLVSLLHSHRFRYIDERELQNGIERLLAGNAFEYQREVVLGPVDRIDFLVEPGIGLEVKVARRANAGDVSRQVARYLQSPRIQSLVFVTDRRQLGLRIGAFNGKTVHHVPLRSGLT